MAYYEIGPMEQRANLEAKLKAVRGIEPSPLPGVGAIAGGQLSEARPPLQDYGTELRILKSALFELKEMTNKIAEEFHKRIERLEMLVGS